MWAFLQDPSRLDRNGCQRLADSVPAEVIARNLEEYMSAARLKNMKLILTAYSRTREWDGAAQDILVKGKSLTPMTVYTCNAGNKNYGYEVFL